MARRFFNPDGLVWRPLGKVGELVMLSLLWGVCSIPLLTMGAATAALYDGTVRCLRRGETDLFGHFFQTFRRELRVGIPATLLWMALLAAPALLLWLLGQIGTDPGCFAVAAALLLLLLFFIFGAACWVFPLLSRFTFSPGGLSIAASRLALGHILRTVLLELVAATGIAACLLFVTPLIFVPGLAALLWSFLLEPVFFRYETGQREA